MKRVLRVLGALILWSGYAQAADSFIDLDDIVVTACSFEQEAGESLRRVEVIPGEDSPFTPTDDIASLIEDVHPVVMSNYGGPGAVKSLRMRGATASQVLVLVDGKPVNSARDGEADLSRLPVTHVERVEVMPGPASSHYGSYAMGGTVNVITRKPVPGETDTSVTVSAGTGDTRSAAVFHSSGVGSAAYSLSAEHTESDGFRENTAYDTNAAAVSTVFTANELNNFTIDARGRESRVGTPGPAGSPDTDDTQKSRLFFLSGEWDFHPDDTTVLTTQVFSHYDRLEFFENSAGSFFDIAGDKSFHTTIARGMDLRLRKQFCDWYTAIAGVSYTDNRNDSTKTGDHEYIARAGFLENRFDAGDDLSVSLTGRVDDYSNFGSEFTPSVTLLYHASENTSIRALAAQSFRAPSFNDLYWPDEGWSRGNPDLRPEQGTTYEIGFETRASDLIALHATAFRSVYDDLINWEPAGLVWQPMNVNKARIKGVETGVEFTFTEDISLDGTFTYSNAINVETGAHLVYQPEHTFTFAARHADIYGFKVSLNGRWVGHRYNDATNTTKVKHFFVAGLDLSREFPAGITAFVTIDNLFDRDYAIVYDYPMPGFFLKTGFTWEI